MRRGAGQIAYFPQKGEKNTCFYQIVVVIYLMLVHSVRHQDLQEAKEVPNIQSAKKRVKVSETKNLRNRMVKSGVKTSIRKLNAAMTEGADAAATQYVATTSAIDKAVAKGIIHKNAANRKKARLAKMIAKA